MSVAIPKERKCKIVYVALLVTEDERWCVEDAINETLRGATQDPDGSGIVDYAFNINREEATLPKAVPFEIADDYEEGQFLRSLPDVPTKTDTYLHDNCDLAVMDAVADVIRGRHDDKSLIQIKKDMEQLDVQDLYSYHIGPAIDEVEHKLRY